MITVIIPTLNEEDTVADVIDGCKPYADEILVVDGRSKDCTFSRAQACDVECIIDDGKGKGAALRQAAKSANGDIIVFIDADGSHDPRDIPAVIRPIQNGIADHVTASRLLGGSSELHGGFDEFFRLAGSSFITACINWRYNVRLSDSQNGFRAIKKRVFLALNLQSNSTTIEQEMIFKTLANGYRIVEIPSHEYCRKGGVSKVSPARLWHKYLFSLIVGMIGLPRINMNVHEKKSK
jgi:dolichol-phosphate mannosyltransferase